MIPHEELPILEALIGCVVANRIRHRLTVLKKAEHVRASDVQLIYNMVIKQGTSCTLTSYAP